MEFFRTLSVKSDECQLQSCLTARNLDQFSNMLFPIGEQTDDHAEIGGIWGEFNLIRTKIRGGVRFALKECPNALSWTVTAGYPPAPDGIVVHLTINRVNKVESLVQEIEEFLDDQIHCLKEFLSSEKKEVCAS